MAIQGLTQAQSAFLEQFVLVSAPVSGGDDAGAAKLYQGLLGRAQKLAGRIAKLTPDAQKLLLDGRRKLGAGVGTAQKQAEAGQMPAAAATMKDLVPVMRSLDGAIDLADTYAAEAAKFLARLTEARGRTDGAIAIADYLKRMEDDDTRRRKAEAQGDLKAALIICEALDNRHEALMQDADRGRDYALVRKEVETEIARLTAAAPGGGPARAVIADCREMLEVAANFIKSDNWVGAVLMARKARNELKVGTDGLDLTRKLDEISPADDFDAAFQTFTDALRRVTGLRGARHFAGELRAIRDQGETARKLLPDIGAAAGQLDEATARCKALTRPILDHGRYVDAARSAAAQLKSVAAMNRDKCIAAEIAAATRAMKSATARAKSGDYAAAMDRLGDAESSLAQGHAAAAAYLGTLRDGRLTIARALKSGTGDGDRLRRLFADIDTAFAARDLTAAAGLAAEIPGAVAATA